MIGRKDFKGAPLIGGYAVDKEEWRSESHAGRGRQPEERADVAQARAGLRSVNGHGRARS